uniref:Uncharacterized protein n=1 Tax=Kalanchoe fedtschenkoi TaxID=63787 RepID=A0A7N0TVH3_KALFE
MGCTFDALKTYLTQMVEIFVDCVRNPVFFDREVNETLSKMDSEIANESKDLPNLLLEAIHSTGYSGALANPLLPTEPTVDRLNASLLEEFVAEHYTAPRIALAAYGAEHEELLSVMEPLLSDLPKVSRPAEP